MKNYLIIPTYNEKENIKKLLLEIFSLDLPLNILVVDDNSPDGTGDAVLQLKDNMKKEKLFLLRRPKKEGLGKAYAQAFQLVLKRGADFVYCMDGDFSHRPYDLKSLLNESEDIDLILGSRWIRGGVAKFSYSRRLLSKLANFFVRLAFGLRVLDATAGFRRYSHGFLKNLDFDKFVSRNYFFQAEMTYYAKKGNFKIKEIPIVFQDRFCGKTKMTIGEMLNSTKDLLKLWFVLRFKKEIGLKNK